MNISEFCIRHPVATTLMSAALVVSGAFAYMFLPVAALPRTEFPVVNVSASLPGASPDTMANAVATPLIKQFSAIAGIDSISSTSSQGTVSIAIQFELNRDIDSAAADVQSAIARVQKQLPAEMTDPPSYRKVNPADAPILLLTLSSEIAPLQDMDAFAQQVISPALSTIDGVAQVQVFGSQKYAVRVQLNPDALAARGIGVDEVQAAITAANANTPIGSLKNTKQSLTIQAQTELSNADQFRNIIVATRNGRPMRLGDLAVVTDSVEDNQTASWYNGTRAILLGVFRQPEANTVEVVDRIRALLPSFESQLPRGAALNVLNDRSTSIRDAVHDVQLTLALTIALVIMVIFLFLAQSLRHRDPGAGSADFADRHARGDVSAQLQHRQHFAARLDARSRSRCRRRHRDGREHSSLYGGRGPQFIRCRAQGQPRNRLHHHLDLHLAGGRFHSGADDGRDHRAHLQ